MEVRFKKQYLFNKDLLTLITQNYIMVKHFIALAFTLIYFFASNAISQNYRDYYNTINQAEISIVDLDFLYAYDTYKQTFSCFEKKHLNDLRNASLCAIIVGEYNQAKVWIMEMLSKGLEISTFKNRIYKKLPEPYWAEIKQNNNFLRSVYLSRIDSNYYKVLDTLRSREQDFLINRKSQSSYDSLIYEHAKVLHTLINEQGIPPVPIFGRFQLPLDVLLHHFGLRNRLKYAQQSEIDLNVEPYKSMNFAPYDLEPILTQAVFNGDLTPSFLASAMAHSELDPTRQLGGVLLIVDLETKTISYETVSEEKIKAIDTYRQSIGLETVRDALKKQFNIAYYYSMNSFPFDEHIKRFKEIGYTLKENSRLGFESKEYLEVSRIAADVIFDIRVSFYKNNSNTLLNKSNNEQFVIDNISDLLKEFRFNNCDIKILTKPKNE
jgi:hypothetical protein